CARSITGVFIIYGLDSW
nr:immunoglobulin heavy chain junction region [Macaca mulatta]MOW75323.1 immunoglobulin heavy chain junction region [Macaca mulatta]MOW76064.1 immunoglobulin heavy chain junction region [Macaca mulatta]MOW76688.1 immunoglobulin heavy chain junction region [Macaca mulatta]MOW76814.1 immunoglobulin heavy chain junction region [Macaca mulatta]